MTVSYKIFKGFMSISPIGGQSQPQFPAERLINPYEAQFERLESAVEGHGDKTVTLMMFDDMISRLRGIRPQTPKLEDAIKNLQEAKTAYEQNEPVDKVLNFIQQAWNDTAVPL